MKYLTILFATLSVVALFFPPVRRFVPAEEPSILSPGIPGRDAFYYNDGFSFLLDLHQYHSILYVEWFVMFLIPAGLAAGSLVLIKKQVREGSTADLV